MKNSLKSFLLRLLPYAISIAIGLILFAIVRRIEQRDEDVSNLLINISSDLLSIPFVFICYEVVNKVINRDLNNTLFKSTTFNIDSLILNIVNSVRTLMGYNDVIDKNNLEEFLKLSKRDISKKLTFKDSTSSKDLMDKLAKSNKELYDIMHESSTIQVLSSEQIKNLLYLSREIDILHNRFSLIADKTVGTREKSAIAENLENMVNSIKNWIDTTEIDALVKHQAIKII